MSNALVANVSFYVIRENKILGNISEFTDRQTDKSFILLGHLHDI